MPRTVGKKTFVAKDIWIAYAAKLLKENPGWKGKHREGMKCKHYSVGYVNAVGKWVETASYPRFRRTIEYYFDLAKKAIIQGDCINMTSNVGKICIKRVERDFRKIKQCKIDWGKTRKQPLVWSEEKQKMVYSKKIYFTSPEWHRIGWIKSRDIENESVYEFAPTQGNATGSLGFTGEFISSERKDPLLKYRYLYNPLKLTAQ